MNIIETLFDDPPKRARFITRKITIEDENTIIYGLSGVGKTALVLNYLYSLVKKRFLYLDMHDLRLSANIDYDKLQTFCRTYSIDVIAIENYNFSLKLPYVKQVLLTSELPIKIDGFRIKKLTGLDFEEFIAFDSRFDNLQDSFSRFLKNGNFPGLIYTHESQHLKEMQSLIRLNLSNLEIEIITQAAQNCGRKVSAHQIFTKIKILMKTSKDSFYKHFDSLQQRGYIYLINKYNQPRAVKKLFLCDFKMQSILSFKKDFNLTFANLILLELLKHDLTITYTDDIDFYIETKQKAILAIPFINHEQLDLRLHNLDEMIDRKKIKKIDIVTMNREQHFNYKNVLCDIVPFTQWAFLD